MASDNIDDTPSFLKAVCNSLVTVLLTHAPKQVSPKKLLNSSSPFISPTINSSDGDSGPQRIKLYSSKGRPPSLDPSSPRLETLTKIISLYSGNTSNPSFPPFPEDADEQMYKNMASRKGLLHSEPYAIRLAMSPDTVWPMVYVRVLIKLPPKSDDGQTLTCWRQLFQSKQGMAIWDTGADVTCIPDDVVIAQLQSDETHPCCIQINQ